MKDDVYKTEWDKLMQVIQRSYQIETHLDFFNWQQEYVIPLFAHDVLIAVWGDFEKGNLNYDVSSKENGIRTKSLMNSLQNFNGFVHSLYKNWLCNDKRWYRINDFFSIIDEADLPNFFNNELKEIKSILVYGVNDIRGHNDCIYMFLDKRAQFPVPNLFLGMLMPHLDAALRRIESFEHIELNADPDISYLSQGLTDREHEILHWVQLGKTNTEISAILSISLNTVKNHLKRIFSKLDVSTRAHAVAFYKPPKINGLN
jgi:transcriptional regulator EpsA